MYLVAIEVLETAESNMNQRILISYLFCALQVENTYYRFKKLLVERSSMLAEEASGRSGKNMPLILVRIAGL